MSRFPDLPAYAGRLFGVPLLIQAEKLDTILTVLGPKLGLDQAAMENSATPPLVAPGAFSGGADGGQGKPYTITREGIAVIPIMGTLVKRSGGLRALSGLASYQHIEYMVMDAATDAAVKGIILDVDSNGGEVAGVFDLADIIADVRDLKPIWSVANDAMYSAAYALGATADKVYVTRTGGVGSIGVVALHLDQSGADEAAGLKYTYIHAGAQKVAGNPHEPLAASAHQSFQAEIDRMYGIFTGTVARVRGLSEEEVRDTEARTFDGAAAIALGLADRIGTLDNALADMAAYLEQSQNSFTPAARANPAQGINISTKENSMLDETPTGGAVAPDTTAAAENTSAGDTTQNQEAAVTASRAQGRADALAYVQEVTEMCALAGMPAAAAGFIKENKPVGEVRSSLLTKKADAYDRQPISGSHLGVDMDAAAPQTPDRGAIFARRKEMMKGGLKHA